MFPGMRAIGDNQEMEEERRLCYVAITRAKNHLTVSYARQRMLYGRTNASLPSRFLREIPESYTVKKGGYHTPSYTQPFDRFTVNYPRESSPRKTSYLAGTISSSGQNKSYLELSKGDMVQHTAFGRGMVLSVMKMGGDALLEIAFDDLGTKKLMAKTASAHMKKL